LSLEKWILPNYSPKQKSYPEEISKCQLGQDVHSHISEQEYPLEPLYAQSRVRFNHAYPDICSKSRLPMPLPSLQHLPEEDMGSHEVLYLLDASRISGVIRQYCAVDTADGMQGIAKADTCPTPWADQTSTGCKEPRCFAHAQACLCCLCLELSPTLAFLL